MRNPGGYATLHYEDGRIVECDTYQCGHCQRVVHVKPKCDPAELGGMCYSCTKMLCRVCVDDPVCVPLEERLLREEARYHALRSYGD